MVGDKLKKIITQYETVSAGESDKKCVCIHGDTGTGKSALMEKLSNSLLLNGANVFFYINTESLDIARDEKYSDIALREILRQLLRMYIDKTDKTISNFVSSYINGTLGDETIFINYNKDLLIKFIYDCVKTEPPVFIIDDLDRSDTFTINLISNLMEINALQFLIFSRSDIINNKTISDFLIQRTKQIEYIQLQSEKLFNKQAHTVPAALDEALLVLKKPGREKQLITHYSKAAQLYAQRLSFEKAASVYNDALEVCRKLKNATTDDETECFDIDMEITEINLLISITESLLSDRQYIKAFKACLPVLPAIHTKMTDNLPAETIMKLSEKNVTASILLAKCCDKLNFTDIMREYVMICEAFFCLSQNRTQYYNIYTGHILRYLRLLAEIDERHIFREKLKQAYSVCLLDDNKFTCSLLYEEGNMLLGIGDSAKAFELLTDARTIAASENLYSLWDEITISLASCSEQMDNLELSAMLWAELIEKSYNPVNTAQALINLAVMTVEQGCDEKTAVLNIRKGIDLYTLSGETLIINQIYEHLKYTPLSEYFIH